MAGARGPAQAKSKKGAARPRAGYRYLRRSRAPEQQRLFSATDNGGPTTIPPEPFAPSSREPGWGPYAEPFIRLNQVALAALDARLQVTASSDGASVRIVPGGRVGAVPLRSAQTGHVAGLGDLSRSVVVAQPGQSGQLGSRHCDDLARLRIEGEYRPCYGSGRTGNGRARGA